MRCAYCALGLIGGCRRFGRAARPRTRTPVAESRRLARLPSHVHESLFIKMDGLARGRRAFPTGQAQPRSILF